MAKIYDETYGVEIFTEDGQRWVKCSCGAFWVIRSFKTREELNKIIGDYIKDTDEGYEFAERRGF